MHLIYMLILAHEKPTAIVTLEDRIWPLGLLFETKHTEKTAFAVRADQISASRGFVELISFSNRIACTRRRAYIREESTVEATPELFSHLGLDRK